MVIAFIASFILGFAKAGFKGLGILIVTLFALVYGARPSVGILVPLLVLADVFAIVTYRHHVAWRTLIKLLPWMVAGVLIGVYFGDHISEDLFKRVLAIIIIVSAIIMVFWEQLMKTYVPDNHAFAGLMGLSAGFATMIGNLAGAFANIYFLAMRYTKNKFIGTAAWLFFFINIFKVPFHVWVWGTINLSSLKTGLYLAPAVVLGFFTGIRLIRYVSNEQFKYYVIGVTILGAGVILLR